VYGGTAIKHPVQDRVKPSFVIFDIRALWRSALRMPGCQNYKWRLNPVLHRVLYSCTPIHFIAVPIWQQWASKGFRKCRTRRTHVKRISEMSLLSVAMLMRLEWMRLLICLDGSVRSEWAMSWRVVNDGWLFFSTMNAAARICSGSCLSIRILTRIGWTWCQFHTTVVITVTSTANGLDQASAQSEHRQTDWLVFLLSLYCTHCIGQQLVLYLALLSRGHIFETS